VGERLIRQQVLREDGVSRWIFHRDDQRGNRVATIGHTQGQHDRQGEPIDADGQEEKEQAGISLRRGQPKIAGFEHEDSHSPLSLISCLPDVVTPGKDEGLRLPSQ